MDSLTILIQLSAVLLLLYFYFNHKFSYWSKRGIPNPTPIPILGTIWKVLWKGQVHCQMEWAKKYGKMYGNYGGNKPSLVVNDHELIKQVMVKDFHLFVNREKNDFPHEIWSRNLFSLQDDDWKRVRTITSPSFTSGKLRGMHHMMNRCVDKLGGYFDKLAKGDGVFDTKEVVAGFTIDVIASTSFATETNSNDDRSNKNSFVQHGLSLLNFSLIRLICLIMTPKFLQKILGFTLIFPDEDFNFFVGLAKEVIRSRKESKVKSNRSDLVQLMMDTKLSEKDLAESSYDKLTASEDKIDQEKDNAESTNDNKIVKSLSENEIIAQCILFFIAGFETTASTITNCLFELAMNQDIQERLLEELQQKLDGLDVNSSEYYDKVMTQIPYLDAVMKETLRKYPPLTDLTRRVSKDGYVLGGVALEKDMEIEIQTYAVHHSAEYYPDPERYDPERFMPENKHLLTPYTYLPFGQGPRNCIGMRFAYQEIKLCLAKIVPQFLFTPTENTPDKLKFRKFILLSAHNFPLKVSKR